jgi:hypothetical protein
VRWRALRRRRRRSRHLAWRWHWCAIWVRRLPVNGVLSVGGNSSTALGFVGYILSLVGAAESNDLIARMLDVAPAHHVRAKYVAGMALNCGSARPNAGCLTLTKR